MPVGHKERQHKHAGKADRWIDYSTGEPALRRRSLVERDKGRCQSPREANQSGRNVYMVQDAEQKDIIIAFIEKRDCSNPISTTESCHTCPLCFLTLKPFSDMEYPVVWRRSHVPTVFISSQPETYPGWMQDKLITRLLHLIRLASSLEAKRTAINALPAPSSKPTSLLAKHQTEAMYPTHILDSWVGTRDWRLLVDLDQRLCFPAEIAATNFRPDLVFWSSSLLSAFIVELTVPWEDAVGEAYEQKSLKYSELAADTERRGWKTKVYPVEVGCRGFVCRSAIRLLKELGIRGQALRQAVNSLSNAAEQFSQ
ncbi:hypothetical protein L3Q82_004569 [Scortum barcoo]|uniref:Uncharacterized protein n=1 Tax=Scortum barcoo TaxID=214431 RepID=A0ACB8VH77_9TELE|nr:hypothetical protein L3Q82_004569 [Scortum barcoo]